MPGKYGSGKGKTRRKPKFSPEITRVKLNPEQAVLVCDCYKRGTRLGGPHDTWTTLFYCKGRFFNPGGGYTFIAFRSASS